MAHTAVVDGQAYRKYKTYARSLLTYARSLLTYDRSLLSYARWTSIQEVQDTLGTNETD